MIAQVIVVAGKAALGGLFVDRNRTTGVSAVAGGDAGDHIV